ncbi:overexpressed in colon carcinoma 1 protein homolog [Sinocyclocheilus grahami]|uniref:overexpressed in colon carcinoma 1 protein homolog n=1 Tax=Sinocyclocheilus grahami TaxID=75366 RepID=UPI0007ACCC37|nr:PREDICTED: overexpressed in colon carcinoma 1 protein homolog [Sinocyclocheilus grahami]
MGPCISCCYMRTEEPSPDDEKRRNYGGVYVGLPADLNTVAASQSKSTRKGEEHTQRKTVIKIK